MSKYTQDQLLNELKQFWNTYGYPPSSKRFHIHENIYRRTFGGWNKALQQAGVPTKEQIKQKYYCQCCSAQLNNSKKKFCNSSCAARVNNTKRGKVRTCHYCGGPRKTGNTKYCSTTCSFDDKKQKHVIAWKTGQVSGSIGKQGQISSTIRRYLFDKYGSKCVQCGWCEKHPSDGRIPLEVDHIDGDSTNNNEDNLRLLCPNCHSLTDSYKARNRGKSTRIYEYV